MILLNWIFSRWVLADALKDAFSDPGLVAILDSGLFFQSTGYQRADSACRGRRKRSLLQQYQSKAFLAANLDAYRAAND